MFESQTRPRHRRQSPRLAPGVAAAVSLPSLRAYRHSLAPSQALYTTASTRAGRSTIVSKTSGSSDDATSGSPSKSVERKPRGCDSCLLTSILAQRRPALHLLVQRPLARPLSVRRRPVTPLPVWRPSACHRQMSYPLRRRSLLPHRRPRRSYVPQRLLRRLVICGGARGKTRSGASIRVRVLRASRMQFWVNGWRWEMYQGYSGYCSWYVDRYE
jgi:hypothetical protein